MATTKTATMNGNKTVTVTTELLYYNLSVGATTNQTYSVTFTANATYGGTLPSNVTGQTAAKTFSCPYGCTAKVVYTATAKTGYDVTASAAVTKTMTSAQSVAAASATVTVKSVQLSVGAPTNQTYSVECIANPNNGAAFTKVTGQSTAKTFDCPYGSTMKVTYTAKSGYVASNSVTLTMTSAQTVAAKKATKYSDYSDSCAEGPSYSEDA